MSSSDLQLEKRRVVIALSGGVDSAVAAALLKEKGAIVQALHMTNWDDDDGYCTAAKDLQDAREVCARLDIPLHHVNFSKEYRERVFSGFLDEYRAGRTPNPDVLCNREIKFGVLFDHAKRLGGELVATGHYARVEGSDDGATLWKARDGAKDQSYFLHAVPSEALRQTLFPLGELDKNDVRNLARDFALAVHDKRDSTGICFIGERPFREFLEQYLPAKPGPLTSIDGEPLGTHNGLMYYTIGQRQGLGIGGRRNATDDAWYVVEKAVDTNTLIVAQGDHPALYTQAIEVVEPHWIGANNIDRLDQDNRTHCRVKVRYRQADQSCTVLRRDGTRLEVAFETPQRAVAPGQYAVFYDGERCLGGGVIDRALPCATAVLKDAM